jgi:(4-(4-[2-(gamma-L-glutamylamino)ethyl]phenoxymethyl)furan-2-yl)methanamine synthase
MTITAGYDVGGAHLKVALVAHGTLTHVEQIACPLWRGLDQLDSALAQALEITRGADRHAVTMTGELADIFPDRYSGVATLVEKLTIACGPETWFWLGARPEKFGRDQTAIAHFADVASTNFLATATLAAARARDGLLIDMGSTTTDIIQLADGKPTASGHTDAARLASGELVYTGLTRTPVMAVTQHGVFAGQRQTLARDPFATMADVRRITCDLPADVDQHTTADGRGTSESESLARLARCFGRDVEPGTEAEWAISARMIAEAQIRSIHDGCLQVLSRQPPRGPLRIITAGIGDRVAAEVARRLDLPALSFADLIKAPARWNLAATRCAPAVALALLLDHQDHAGSQ